MGGVQDLGLVGVEGELYYHPTKTVALRGITNNLLILYRLFSLFYNYEYIL